MGSGSRVVPPPWRLRARGYAVLFAPSSQRELRSRHRFVDPHIRFLGGFGLLLLLEYDRSEVGPYHECLYIPGYASIRAPASPPEGGGRKGDHAARLRRGHSIAWIRVSSEPSRDGGIANWGIPKRLGTISRGATTRRGLHFHVTGGAGERLLSVVIPRRAVRLRPLSSISLPLRSSLLPHTLVQVRGSTVYETCVEATGRLRTARRARIVSHAPETEAIAARRVWATFSLSRVRLLFPSAIQFSRAS